MTQRTQALVGYHQFSLAPVGVDAIVDPSRPFDVLQVTGDGRALLVNTGITDGPVWLSIGRPDPGGPRPGTKWDAVEEATMSINSDLIFTAPTIEDTGIRQPAFIPAKPGPHVVTVFAWGMGNAPNEYLDPSTEPVEEYAVWIRPQEP